MSITNKNVRPIPKYILTKIRKHDLRLYPTQKGLRLNSYLTTLSKELVKVTVAIKNYKGKWYCKQVAVHGVVSDKCLVKDLEYNYVGMGYRVGWFAEGLSKHKKWFEYGKWCSAGYKYYNPHTILVNKDFLKQCHRYKYSAWELFDYSCIIKYLRIYVQYPQVEYLVKMGLTHLYSSVTILKRIARDKKFCKWLIANSDELKQNHYYMTTILQAYKQSKPLKRVQDINAFKKRLRHEDNLSPIKDLFSGELDKFYYYLEKQSISLFSYTDYLNACNYLGLDMSLPKNRFPHNFKRWHDVRIDEYNSAKAQADEIERAELYAKFGVVANKYMSLQKQFKCGYVIIIATSPKELLHEGSILGHCVGKMGYDQKMVRQESLIFFLRDCGNIDAPLITIEYSLKSKKILQAYGANHEKPNDNISSFINNVWLPYANRKLNKIHKESLATHLQDVADIPA